MAKNIILLSDGTGNSAAKVWRTNVWRTYEALELTDPRQQVAYYDDGVGTSSFKLFAALSGAFGYGLKRNVLDLYCFLCRNYREGDRIFGFGFSRGAYTLRIVVGLVADQGLVSGTSSEPELRSRAKVLYREYRYKRFWRWINLSTPFRLLRIGAMRLLRRFTGAYAWMQTPRPWPRVQFLGLWDTVSAYGLPIEEMTRGFDLLIWPISFGDRYLNRIVRRACHALSVNDERTTFHPVLWTEHGEDRAARLKDERISQVWFAGMHADVGGGYPDTSLANVPLDWMIGEAEACGLKFNPEARADVKEAAKKRRIKLDLDPHGERKMAALPHGPMHDSRHGLASYYRYGPRSIERLSDATYRFGKHDDVEIALPKIHESVFERIEYGVHNYVPFNLPAEYALVTRNGEFLQGKRNPYEHPSQSQSRANQQEKAWNTVWWRRVCYFTSLFVTLYLLLFPLIQPGSFGADFVNWLTLGLTGLLARAAQEAAAAVVLAVPLSILEPFVSMGLRAANLVLPSFISFWTRAYAANINVFMIEAGILVFLVLWTARLQAQINSRMSGIWAEIVESGPKPVKPAPLPSDAVYWFRTCNWYLEFHSVLKRWVVPYVCAVGFLLLAIYFADIVASRIWFGLRETAGWVCKDLPKPNRLTTAIPRITVRNFDISQICWASGIELKAGETYEIAITITSLLDDLDAKPDVAPKLGWRDRWTPTSEQENLLVQVLEKLGLPSTRAPLRSIDSGLEGFGFERMSGIQYLGLPYRRSLLEPWFRPIARIGFRGSDNYPLEPSQDALRTPPVSELKQAITPRRSGQLFLFVNDAVRGVFEREGRYYGNNIGTADVTVTLAKPAR